jgi:hypothetical protein
VPLPDAVAASAAAITATATVRATTSVRLRTFPTRASCMVAASS